jgi:hypothetical protein
MTTFVGANANTEDEYCTVGSRWYQRLPDSRPLTALTVIFSEQLSR